MTDSAKTVDKPKKDTSSEAQGRFVVSLPKEVGTMVDELGQRIAAKVLAETGVSFELSRAQIVQAVVKSALDKPDEGSSAA